jgi:hypothetical protein
MRTSPPSTRCAPSTLGRRGSRLAQLLQAKNKAEGWTVGIHVDAASGGFVAPFIKPDLIWDFRLPSVRRVGCHAVTSND